MKNKANRIAENRTLFDIASYLIVGVIALLCVLPFILIVSGSFTDEAEVLQYGYSIIPGKFSTEAYKSIFHNTDGIFRAYGVTILITVVGTIASLFLSTMAAYVLQRKDFEWRNQFTFFIYFTTLFSGGLVPWYIWMTQLGMRNTLLALILPHMFSVFNILILRNFIATIPDAITESGTVDGASDIRIFIQLILPLSTPVLATIGLFTALSYWNEWYNAMLFVSDEDLFPLQYYLYNILNKSEALQQMMANSSANLEGYVLPSETTKLAMTVVATGPILLLYPFVQRYFVKGIMIGAVKG